MKERFILFFVACTIVFGGCASQQDPPGCQPLDAQALAAEYAAEAAPVVAAGKCDGYTSRTCPDLKPARDRFDAARAEWVQRCGETP